MAMSDHDGGAAAPAMVWRRKSIKIDSPVDHFAGWAFSIERQHWPLFGLSYREFKKDKRPYMSWALWSPPAVDFDEGTVFRRGDQFLQVAYSGGDGFVEVHLGRVGSDAGHALRMVDGVPDLSAAFAGIRRTGWLVREADLVDWLRTGVRPAAAAPIDRAHTSCTGLLALALPIP